jgi:hypothetical protein
VVRHSFVPVFMQANALSCQRGRGRSYRGRNQRQSGYQSELHDRDSFFVESEVSGVTSAEAVDAPVPARPGRASALRESRLIGNQIIPGRTSNIVGPIVPLAKMGSRDADESHDFVMMRCVLSCHAQHRREMLQFAAGTAAIASLKSTTMPTDRTI